MKTGHLDLRVDQALIDRIDAWRNVQAIPPSRAAAIGYMLQGWLTEHGTYKQTPVNAEQPLRPARR